MFNLVKLFNPVGGCKPRQRLFKAFPILTATGFSTAVGVK